MNESGNRTTSLANVLDNLIDDTQNISHCLLVELSDLSPGEFGFFEKTWSLLAPGRKCDVLGRLSELAEDNVGYDFGAVFKYALGDNDSTVRQKAIEGLWESEEPSLIRPLLRLLTDDSSDAVRGAAAVALGRFAVLAECRKIDADNIVRLSQPLLKIVNDSNESLPLRRRALEAVAPLSLADVTQVIWAAYRREESEARAGAIRAMGLNRDLLWLPTIIQELASDDPEIRYVAAEAAGALGEAEAAPSVIELTDDPDPEVRLAAIQALGNIGGVAARRVLGQLTQHQDQSICDAATNALAEIAFFEEPFSPH